MIEQALVDEMDRLVDLLDDPNRRGFMTRVEGSKFFRVPPRGIPLDLPSENEVRFVTADMRFMARRKR